MQGEYNFEKDVKKGESAESLLLNTLKKRYPKAYKVQGYFKDFDINIPELSLTLEVKRDFLASKTGNYFIETESGGVSSGIATSKADKWVLIDDTRIVLIPIDWLRTLIMDIPEITYGPKGSDKSRTGKLLPVNRILFDQVAKITYYKT